MEWTKELIAKHTSEENGFDEEAFMEDYKKEFPKHAVIKEDFNSKVEELKQANETLETLKKDHKDVEELQQTIEQHQGRITELEEEKQNQAKEFALKERLTAEGVEYPDLLLPTYKEKVELDDEGNLTGFDELIKEDKANKPKLFKDASTDDKKDENNGFIIQDNKLDGGQPVKLSKREIYDKYPNDKGKRLELLKKMEE